MTLNPLQKSLAVIVASTGFDPSSPHAKLISVMHAFIASLTLNFVRSTLASSIDSEKEFCSNGCTSCPKIPSTNGVSFACAKWAWLRYRVLQKGCPSKRLIAITQFPFLDCEWVAPLSRGWSRLRLWRISEA